MRRAIPAVLRPRSQEQEPESRNDEQYAAQSAALEAGRQQPLEQNEYGDRRDADEIHHAANEEQQHQDPAAAKTINAVLEAHPAGAAEPGTPMGNDESH